MISISFDYANPVCAPTIRHLTLFDCRGVITDNHTEKCEYFESFAGLMLCTIQSSVVFSGLKELNNG